MSTNQNAVDRAIRTLQNLDGEASFAFLAGDSNGLDCTLGHGTHEPAGVHIHLLATHMAALADQYGMDVGDVAKAGVEAHAKMEADGAGVIVQDTDYGGSQQ